MKILLLVIICTWGYGFPRPQPTYKIVSSQEEAALIKYQHYKSTRTGVEPNQYDYKLYQINLDDKTIKSLNIPIIKFTNEVKDED